MEVKKAIIECEVADLQDELLKWSDSQSIKPSLVAIRRENPSSWAIFYTEPKFKRKVVYK